MTSDYSDTALQQMTDEQLDEVYRNLPKWPEAAGVIDTCVRVAKEYRYRQRRITGAKSPDLRRGLAGR